MCNYCFSNIGYDFKFLFVLFWREPLLCLAGQKNRNMSFIYACLLSKGKMMFVCLFVLNQRRTVLVGILISIEWEGKWIGWIWQDEHSKMNYENWLVWNQKKIWNNYWDDLNQRKTTLENSAQNIQKSSEQFLVLTMET